MPKPESEQQTIRGLTCFEVVVAEAQLVGLVAAEVREHGVDRRARDPRTRRATPASRRSSETLRLFRLNVSKKSELSSSWIRRHVAADVAADRGILDLDHLGAEIGELHRPPRAGAVLLDGEDANVGERA